MLLLGDYEFEFVCIIDVLGFILLNLLMALR